MAVPKVKGMMLGAAKQGISAAHCAVGRSKQKKKHGKHGIVLSQNRRGEVRPAGFKVSLVVGK